MMESRASSVRSTIGSEYLGEEPADEGLDMGYAAQEILGQLLDQNTPASGEVLCPTKMIGIFGHWGSGKTHMLNLVGKRVVEMSNNDKHLLVCCFRAWEYEAETDLASAFIRCLVNEGSYPWEQTVPSFDQVLPSGATLRQAAWKFADFVFKLGKSSAIPGVGMLSEIGQALLDLREADKPLPPEPVADQVRKTMGALIDRIAPKGTHLFVLVDDLDRCTPPNIVRLFEWFKNHLDMTRCSYILGLDHRMAAKAIVGHYKDYVTLTREESLDYGFRYLDKLFELEFEILPSSRTEGMVLQRLKMEGNSLCTWTRKRIGKDFGGEPEMRTLLAKPALWVPRILLRTVVTFRMGLDAIMKQNAMENSLLSNDLPSSFPFWLFLLSALHHLFPPDRVEAFVRTDLRPLQKKLGIGGLLDESKGYSSTDPRRELIETLNVMAIEPLSQRQMRYLYQVVREKTPRSFREVDTRAV